MMTTDHTTPAENQPRPPNAKELRLLAKWLSDQGYDPDGAAETARCAYVAVYERYITGNPGYAGKLMSVVWDGSPSFFDVFIWVKGKMVCSRRENGE